MRKEGQGRPIMSLPLSSVMATSSQSPNSQKERLVSVKVVDGVEIAKQVLSGGGIRLIRCWFKSVRHVLIEASPHRFPARFCSCRCRR